MNHRNHCALLPAVTGAKYLWGNTNRLVNARKMCGSDVHALKCVREFGDEEDSRRMGESETSR